MFLQSRTIHVDELRKRVSIGHVMPKSGTAEALLAILQESTTMPSTRLVVRR